MVYVIFGVSCSGKTTIGKKISIKLRIPFYDADDFHSNTNNKTHPKKFSNKFQLSFGYILFLPKVNHIISSRTRRKIIGNYKLGVFYRSSTRKTHWENWKWNHPQEDPILGPGRISVWSISVSCSGTSILRLQSRCVKLQHLLLFHFSII